MVEENHRRRTEERSAEAVDGEQECGRIIKDTRAGRKTSAGSPMPSTSRTLLCIANDSQAVTVGLRDLHRHVQESPC